MEVINNFVATVYIREDVDNFGKSIKRQQSYVVFNDFFGDEKKFEDEGNLRNLKRLIHFISNIADHTQLLYTIGFQQS